MAKTGAQRMAAWVWTCAFCMVGCAGAECELESELAALVRSEEQASAVYVRSSGTWSRYRYHGITSESFWVDLAVRNDAFEKDVGIVWTSDGWATSHWTRAVYEGTLPDGRERWGVDVEDFGARGWGSEPEVEYAAFATMGGTTHWSPFRNHFVYTSVSPDQPIRLLESHVRWDGTTVFLEGETRSLRTSDERRVFVRYTLDGWASWLEVEARAEGGEHAFSIPLAVDPATIEEVAFALRFESDGLVAWENAGGRDYHHRLRPELSLTLAGTPGLAVDGILVLDGSARSALEVSGVSVRVGEGEWVALSERAAGAYAWAEGFGRDGGLRTHVETSVLEAGAYEVEVEVRAGPYVERASARTLEVAGLVAPAATTVLPDVDRGTSWDVDRGSDGRLVVGYDRGLARLDDAGGVELLFEAYEGPGYVRDVEVTSAYVFGLAGDGLVRWDAATGALDRAFGEGGVLVVDDRPLGSTVVCNVSGIAASEDALFLADSCNSRVLRLGHDGSVVDELAVARDTTSSTLLVPVLEGDVLWITSAGWDVVARNAVIAIAAAAGAPLAETERVRVDGAIPYSPEGLAITPEGFWITSGDTLRLVDRAGALRATWIGGGLYEVTPPGVLSIAKHVEVLPDGSIEVLSVQTARLERFELTR